MIKDKVSYILYNEATVNFVYDETIPLNCIYWDTVNVYKQYKLLLSLNTSMSEFNFDIFYNISSESSISKITDNVNHILRSYIIEKENDYSLRIYPTATSSLPDWVTFNPEKKMYCFDNAIFFTLLIDKAVIRQCSYATLPSALLQVSDHYQYANPSRSSICSSPFFANPSSVSKCQYQYGSSFTKMSSCAGYMPDQKILFTNLFTHKTNKKSFEFTTTVYRNIEDVYKIEIFNITDNVMVSILDYKSIVFDKNKTSLYKEAKNHLIDLLKVYEEDYNIEWTENNLINDTSFVNIKVKNNYISNLIPKDSYVNQGNELLKTV